MTGKTIIHLPITTKLEAGQFLELAVGSGYLKRLDRGRDSTYYLAEGLNEFQKSYFNGALNQCAKIINRP